MKNKLLLLLLLLSASINSEESSVPQEPPKEIKEEVFDNKAFMRKMAVQFVILLHKEKLIDVWEVVEDLVGYQYNIDKFRSVTITQEDIEKFESN